MAPGSVHALKALSARPLIAGALGLGLAAPFLLSLGACASLPSGPFTPPPADVTSPVAADIRRLDPEHAAYPSFLQVPNVPADVRPTSAWTRNIFDTLRTRREMEAVYVAIPQTLYGAEAFAQEQRAKVKPPITPAQAAAQSDKTADFAKQGKARATPPSQAQQ